MTVAVLFPGDGFALEDMLPLVRSLQSLGDLEFRIAEFPSACASARVIRGDDYRGSGTHRLLFLMEMRAVMEMAGALGG